MTEHILRAQHRKSGPTVELALAATTVLGNLEGPVFPSAHAIPAAPTVPRAKARPSISAPPRCTDLFRHNGNIVCSLANNHVMDYDKEELADTLDACERVGVQVVGAGMNLACTQNPTLLEIEGISIGFIGSCQTHLGIAMEGRVGVCPLLPSNL